MAATQPVATTPNVVGRDLAKVLRRVVIAALFGVLLVVGGLSAVAQYYSGKVLPGVVVGGVAVGGLSESAARDVIVRALGALEDGQIQLVSERTTGVIRYAEVARAIDTEGMLADALGHGRGGTRFEEAIAGIQGSLRPATFPIRIDYDRPSLAAKLAAFEVLGHRPAVDAVAQVSRGVFTAIPSRDGVEVDTSRVKSLIDTALLDPETPPVIRYEADSLVLAPITSDADVARAISLARRLGNDITLKAGKRKWVIEPRRWIHFEGSGPDLAPVVDTSKAAKIFKNVKKHVTVKPTNAHFLRDRGGRIFGVSASSAGRALDVEGTIDAIQAVLDGRAAGVKTPSKVDVATKAVGPEVTTSEATKKAPLVERIGSWTTYYQVSARNGFAANITVPARRLDGTVIRPGQTFEFWSALGEVSFRTGYRLGAAIVGGRTVEGRALAGGICSVSTTLFNAALRGGLDIVTRRPHWYYISRYPLGLDATVSDTQTMRFRNDTKHPILIRSMASPGVVRFELWSVPNGRSTTLSRPSVSNVVRGYDSVQYTSSLAPGVRKRIEYPVDGKDVSVTRTVRDGAGRVIHHDTFISNYHRMVGITLVGR
ncbi:MAG TPA: VanW family protein [Candidatus Limnocylindrales bacterium]|nr:VanW family protein [Candidatus Limnocylindrales bacterium]